MATISRCPGELGAANIQRPNGVHPSPLAVVHRRSWCRAARYGRDRDQWSVVELRGTDTTVGVARKGWRAKDQPRRDSAGAGSGLDCNPHRAAYGAAMLLARPNGSEEEVDQNCRDHRTRRSARRRRRFAVGRDSSRTRRGARRSPLRGGRKMLNSSLCPPSRCSFYARRLRALSRRSRGLGRPTERIPTSRRACSAASSTTRLTRSSR